MAVVPSSPEPPQTAIAPAETPSVAGLMTLAVGAVTVAALYFGREVFVPIVLAILFSFVLAPFVSLLRRLRVGRVPAVIVAMLVALGVLLSLSGVIGLQVAELASDIPRYQTTIREKISTLREGTIGRLPDVMRRFNREIEAATKDAPAAPSTQAPADQRPTPVEIREPALTPLALAREVLSPIIHPLATAGIVLIVVVFILLQREDLRDRLIRLFGSSDLHRTTAAMDDAARRLSRYFLTQLALNACFGLAITIGLWLIGVPSPVLWGIFAGLMRFVPYIGALLAGSLPVALAAAVDPGWTMALSTLALFLVLEPLMGHVVEPMVYGQSTGLSPFAVVVSAIFWTWLWGPVGLLLSTPLTLCLVVLGRHVERLEFLDVLLGDRPALSPAENFYQRMLAGDPDEALEFADQLLKERSLSSYYDEVALKGLQLAANDASRGGLSRPLLERIKEGTKALVADLDSREDVEPAPAEKAEAEAAPVAPPSDERALPKKPPVPDQAPPQRELPAAWRGERAILCVAGRGPLDEAASAMLVQLLRKHGLGAELVPHEAASRTKVLGLAVEGTAMICLSYLEISGSPAHLRYLLRRLRQRAPQAKILVGLWPAEDAVLSDEKMRTAIGADYYVSSLQQAVKRCLEAACEACETDQAPDAGSTPAPDRAPAPQVRPERVAAE